MTAQKIIELIEELPSEEKEQLSDYLEDMLDARDAERLEDEFNQAGQKAAPFNDVCREMGI